MKRALDVFGRVTKAGAAVSGFCLIGATIIVVFDVIGRLFKWSLVGSHEMVEITMVLAVAFALGYTALEKGHVTIGIILPLFPSRVRSIVEAFTYLISVGTWALIFWGSTLIVSERWLTEKTLIMGIPMLPFRFVWEIGLIIICLIYLMHLLRASGKAVSK